AGDFASSSKTKSVREILESHFNEALTCTAVLFSETLGLINQIVVPEELHTRYSTSDVEWFGDMLATPGRILFGRTYVVSDDHRLHSNEVVETLAELIKKIVIVILFPLTGASTLVGLGLKWGAHM